MGKGGTVMIILKIILILLGLAFLSFGYLIYFKGHYNLINGYESDYKSGRKTIRYAKKVGIIELVLGLIFLFAGICVIIIF